MDLTPAELQWCCKHLGHTLDVHENYYRQLDSTIERVKIARLLYAMDEGDIGVYAGKKIQDIKITGT